MIRSLPCFAREGGRQARGLDDLEDLAQVAVVAVDHLVGQESSAHELLGDGRGAALGLALAGDVLDGCGEDRGRVVALVVPERSILGGGRGVEDELGDLVERDHAALLALEPGELDRAGPVVDDRRLVEGEALQLRGVGQVAAEHGDGAACRHEPERPEGTDAEDERQRDRQQDPAKGQPLRLAAEARPARDEGSTSPRRQPDRRSPGRQPARGTCHSVWMLPALNGRFGPSSPSTGGTGGARSRERSSHSGRA